MFGNGIAGGIAAQLGKAFVIFFGLFALSFVVLLKLFGLGPLAAFFGGFVLTLGILLVYSQIARALKR